MTFLYRSRELLHVISSVLIDFLLSKPPSHKSSSVVSHTNPID